MAIKSLQSNSKSTSYNLGDGNGFSVKEVIDTAIKITGNDIKVNLVDARVGDPARLVADASMARKELNWTPIYSSLDTIIKHAWLWEQRLSNLNK